MHTLIDSPVSDPVHFDTRKVDFATPSNNEQVSMNGSKWTTYQLPTAVRVPMKPSGDLYDMNNGIQMTEFWTRNEEAVYVENSILCSNSQTK